MLKIYDFSVDYVVNPTLVRTSGLRFGWKLDSDRTNVLQTLYRIEILRGDTVAADTGVVMSGAFFDITVPGLVLNSRTDYTVRLTVADNCGDTAVFTHTVCTEIKEDEWDAEWIKPEEHIDGWAPYLRTKFEAADVRCAVLYACGLGCAEYYINGSK
ncbi:MAG: hypothetical protein IJ302_07720, partial [Clostridia bacterium]|nr:hypothetical protein [Clostridia bacterium]